MKHCPFCNSELPDEASFCLNCVSVLNYREEPAGKPKVGKPKVKKTKAVIWNKQNQRILACCITACLIVTLTFAMLYRTAKLPLSPQNSYEPKTTLVPVTEENGETVTNPQGEVVYEAVTLEPPTEKSVFSNIIGSIFGNDEANDKSSESQSDISNATVPPSDITDVAPSVTPSTEPPATTEDDNAIDEDPAKVFEYEPYNQTKPSTTQISITKYKGNASFVTIPDSINGLMVVEIQKDAFLDNSKIKTIDIVKGERPFIWLRGECFHNLSSLTTVNLYNNDLGLRADFAVNCPIKDFNITFWQFKFVNGAIYSHNSHYWEFNTFCGNPCYDTLTLETWCKGISSNNNLDKAPNLKVINVRKETTFVPTDANDYHKNLEAINVEDGNERYMSKDGVLFNQRLIATGCYGNIYDTCYPGGKKDKTFTMPTKEGFSFHWDTRLTMVNPYLEEIYLPMNSSITVSSLQNCYPNLKKLHFAKGNPCYDEVKYIWTGETVYY